MTQREALESPSEHRRWPSEPFPSENLGAHGLGAAVLQPPGAAAVWMGPAVLSVCADAINNQLPLL